MSPSSFYHYYPFPFNFWLRYSLFSSFTSIQIHPVVTKFTTITHNYSPPFSFILSTAIPYIPNVPMKYANAFSKVTNSPNTKLMKVRFSPVHIYFSKEGR